MDLLNSGDKKKKLILIIVGAVLLVTLIVGLVLWGISKEDEVDDTEVEDTTPDDISVSEADWSNHREQEKGSTTAKPIPSIYYGGDVAEYVDNSTFAYLKVNIGGDESKQKTLTLTTETIVFDASKNIAVMPSTLNSAEKVTVLAKGRGVQFEEEIEVAIINGDQPIIYFPISGVVEGKEFIKIANDNSKTFYVIPQGVTPKNALTGEDLTSDSIKTGDRVFIYEGELLKHGGAESKEDKGNAELDSTEDIEYEYREIEVKEIYVYPSKEIK